jgi:SAM-dependent methyltransferase
MKKKIIKWAMRLFEKFPSEDDHSLAEIFNHDSYTKGSAEERTAIMQNSSETLFQLEQEQPIDQFFNIDISPLLRGKTILDLGCFTGGRGAAWYKRYKLGSIVGVDVFPESLIAAKKYFRDNDLNSDFVCSKGEGLPFLAESFDAIITYDVFEHVQNIGIVVNECCRVIKQGGLLIAIFPSYYHPIEHHLSLVSRAPFIHYFFKGDELIRAYNEIIEERGNESYWYRRKNPKLEDWEKCNTINGLTRRKFKNLINNSSWEVLYDRTDVLLRKIGEKHWFLNMLRHMITPLAQVRGFDEFLSTRVVYILRKQ